MSSWYPEADQLDLLRAVSFLLPGTPDPWMVIGRIAARGDLSDLYRNMVRPGDLRDALRTFSSLWRTMAANVFPKRARRGIPVPASPAMSGQTGGA